MQQSSIQEVRDQFTQMINCTIYFCMCSIVVLIGRSEILFITMITDCTNNRLLACVTFSPSCWLSFFYVECSIYLSLSVEACAAAPEPGPCKGLLQRHFYNSTSMSCQMFSYHGCGGNQNNFKTKKRCLEGCHPDGEE